MNYLAAAGPASCQPVFGCDPSRIITERAAVQSRNEKLDLLGLALTNEPYARG